jgi:DNA-binding LytR/AlgR family response regulator
VLGIALYVLGFLVEGPHKRWNILTFLGSLEIAFLTGIIPLTFFTAINYRYLFSHVIRYNETETASAGLGERVPEDLIRISSQLKKEDLSFYPNQFIYCAADGNYVVFHLIINEKYIKKMIRNSINNIEQQLIRMPSILRIHRAFIVNLKMVESKRGNTMGYQLKFNNIDGEVPVSRNNTKNFDQKIRQFR